jgi:SAM-dependent methyltransferase
MDIGFARGGLLDQLDDDDDYTKIAVDIHQRQVPAGVTFVLHDCNQDFDFADESSIDIVFAGEVIEHIFDGRRFLEQIHRVLRPGGAVALTTPDLLVLVNRIVMPLGKMPYFTCEPYHYDMDSRSTLVKLAGECGFEVRRMTSSHVLVSSRRNRFAGAICERLGDLLPSPGAHVTLFAVKKP